MGNIIIPFIVSIIISLSMTPPVAKRLAVKIGAVDVPKDERRVHKKPMPLMGGVAIYVSIIITSIIFLPMDRTLISIILGGTIILISGIIDDVKGLSLGQSLYSNRCSYCFNTWGCKNRSSYQSIH